MNRLFRISTLVAFAGLILGAASSTQAAFITGTQGLADNGSPTIAGGPTLSTATIFNFSMLTTQTNGTGSFMTTPSSGLNLGAASLNVTMPTTFTFGNDQFGRFTATSVTTAFSSDQFRSFNILGTFVSGTNFGVSTTNPASFNVNWTANGTIPSGISYSASGTLAVPAGAVPEPASVAMLGVSLLGLAGYSARRRLGK